MKTPFLNIVPKTGTSLEKHYLSFLLPLIFENLKNWLIFESRNDFNDDIRIRNKLVWIHSTCYS
jgi:hypothetical protein